MTIIKQLASAVVVSALFALPLAGHAADTPGQIVKDSVITTKIKAAQATDKTVSALKIDVETDHSGKVVLSGKAKSKAEMDRAVELAKGVQGVTSVQNNMTLDGASTTRP
ncbi:MAG: BON domain-containing protein [Burkholderiaceae bacterium]